MFGQKNTTQTCRGIRAMKIVSPIQFKQAFLKVAVKYEQEILHNWSNRKYYTDILIRKNDLPQIAQELGLKSYSERDYYYLDAILYEEKDTDHFPEVSTYAKYITVAIEHEHDASGTVTEIYKLQLFNTPLKILITYATKNGTEVLLKKYAQIMEGADVFSDFSTQKRQLVIFGSKNSTSVN